MNLKKYTLISTLIGALTTSGVAIVSYIEPSQMVAINSAIVIISTAITSAIEQFIRKD